MNLAPWKIAVLCLASILGTYFSASQAIYFSWQSAFQNRMHEIEYLERMFLTYGTISIILFITNVWLIVLFIKAINRKPGN